ncbi:MAG: hypothetical protein Q9169_007492, partial [Polycauliona sp. 2 TL-2023]
HISPHLAEDLKSSLKSSELLLPDCDAYRLKIKRWADSCEKKAGAILLASSCDDIATTLLFVRSHGIDFAVCGGGHSTSGASSSSGGLVIDLSSMRSVRVDPSAKTITAEGGCLWADVDAAAAQHRLATVGGTINHTGIGGLTLGGGYGWLSGQYGLVIDNLLSTDMVLADGRKVTASPTENDDLFWAVRGAGQSFGVATSFTYRAFEQSSLVFAGTLAFDPLGFPDSISRVLAFANSCVEPSLGHVACILGFAVAPPPANAPLLICSPFFDGPEDQARAFFKPLLDLEPFMNTAAMIPYSSVNSMFNDVAQHGGRKSTKGGAFAAPVRLEFLQSLFEKFHQFVTEVPDAKRSLLLLEFFSPDKVCEVDNRAMAFANRDYYNNILANPQWTDEANDGRCRQWARDMTTMIQKEMEACKIDGRIPPKMEGVGVYGNYEGGGDSSSGGGGRTIFGANYGRLIELKRKWDPTNAFDKGHLLAPQFDAWHGGVPASAPPSSTTYDGLEST